MPPTPVYLPGKFHGQKSVVGYSSKSHKESDTTAPPRTDGEKSRDRIQGHSNVKIRQKRKKLTR